MSELSICFNKHEYEYDVYTLVKAFYPGSEIHTFYKDEAEHYKNEAEHPAESSLRLDVDMFADHLDFSMEDAAGRKTDSRCFPPDTDRLEVKNILKRMIYDCISEKTGRILPWGSLTGIRPTKIPMQLLEAGWRNPDIAQFMRKTYYTSNKKTALAIAIANREKEILEELKPQEGYSLYIGIPFCPSICLYCSFGSHPFDRFGGLAETYLKTLFYELDYIADRMHAKRLQTIYVGGGTPTTLTAEQLGRLLAVIRERFDLQYLKEFTVEAGRPDTVDPEKLAVLRANGVNRISINPQTMNQRTLDLIGRNHTVSQVVSAFHMARDAGFSNINMDLIVGLPGEGLPEVRHTMEQIQDLVPDSLTVHSLALKRATRLHLFKEQYAPISFDNSQEIMDLIDLGAMRMGLEPYYMYRQKNMAGNLENIGYARRGCFGLYNILIMEEKQCILAAGSGASSKFILESGRIERAENVKDLKNYIERIDEMLERKEKYLSCS